MSLATAKWTRSQRLRRTEGCIDLRHALMAMRGMTLPAPAATAADSYKLRITANDFCRRFSAPVGLLAAVVVRLPAVAIAVVVGLWAEPMRQRSLPLQ